MLIDSHCHLQFNSYKDDLNEVISRCEEKDMIMNVVGTQKDTSKKALELALKYENVYATIGIHPIHLFKSHVDEDEASFISHEESFDEKYYSELARSEKVIGVGEIGLDLFHLPKGKTKEEVLERQKKVFIEQYNFAIKNDLPVVIHVRDAHAEMIELLKSLLLVRGVEGGLEQEGPHLTSPKRGGIRGVVHCYTSTWQDAKQYLDLGLYLGFTGIITFSHKKTKPEEQEFLLEVVRNCPLDRILTETDSPYLAPQRYRGEKCEPWMTEEVVNKIAEERDLSYKEVEAVVEANFRKLFIK